MGAQWAQGGWGRCQHRPPDIQILSLLEVWSFKQIKQTRFYRLDMIRSQGFWESSHLEWKNDTWPPKKGEVVRTWQLTLVVCVITKKLGFRVHEFMSEIRMFRKKSRKREPLSSSPQVNWLCCSRPLQGPDAKELCSLALANVGYSPTTWTVISLPEGLEDDKIFDLMEAIRVFLKDMQQN